MNTEQLFGIGFDNIKKLQQKQSIDNHIDTTGDKDYGCDPIGDGNYKMIPSGDIVDSMERCKRLERL